MIRWIARLLSGSLLDRAMDAVEANIEAGANRDALKADIIKEHYRSRADFMRAGGFWLMLIFAAPLAAWWSAVLLYSIVWCQRCAYPQTWSIAALPEPLGDWAGGIVLAIFGVIGLDRFKTGGR